MMKKALLATSLMITLSFTVAMASDPAKKLQKDPNAYPEEIREIIERVEEIKAMDFKSLSRETRKDLKSEMRELKKEANERAGGGLYISTGAIIIILLLIIIL
jgi:ABC-type phosphate/phosphonate transport system substrate-binding protein